MNCHSVFNCVGHKHELTNNRLIKETVLKYVNEAEFKELFTIAALEKVEKVTSSAIAATSSAIKASLDARNAVNDLTVQTMDFVNDAINNTAVEGGVLAATFVTVEEQIEGNGALSLRDFNNQTIMSVNDLSELLKVKFSSYRTVSVKGKRGGIFVYDSTKAHINDGGLNFNGWVRQFSGAVQLEWFCETDSATTDCAPYLQKALAVSRVVKAGNGTFLFKTQVGMGDASTGQSFYGSDVVKVIGNGDTKFLIDCTGHNTPIFTSTKQKNEPENTADAYVGRIEFTGINFVGKNAPDVPNNWEAIPEARNLVDKVFDGDRLYNMYVHHNAFSELYYVMEASKPRTNVTGEPIFSDSGGYSQSVTFSDNHFYKIVRIIKADGLINTVFKDNMCEVCYGGIYTKSLGVVRVVDNVFEAGGQFIDVEGDSTASTISGNYLEWNNFGDVPVSKCAIRITGKCYGTTISGNSFTAVFKIAGFDTEFVDIKLSVPLTPETSTLDPEHYKPTIFGNYSTSRQLFTAGQAIAYNNSVPFMYLDNHVQLKAPNSYFNTATARNHQENNYSFSKGSFGFEDVTYADYSKNNRNYKLSTLISVGNTALGAGNLLIGIIDLQHMCKPEALNKISTITGSISSNLDVMNADKIVIAQAAIKFDLSIFMLGRGTESTSNMYDLPVVKASNLSIQQPSGVPISKEHPTAMLHAQFQSDAIVNVIHVGDFRFCLYVSQYQNMAVGTLGTAVGLRSSLVWQGNVGQYDTMAQYGANMAFATYWW